MDISQRHHLHYNRQRRQIKQPKKNREAYAAILKSPKIGQTSTRKNKKVLQLKGI